MKYKKTIIVLIIVILISIFFISCDNKKTKEKTKNYKYKIGMVTEKSGLEDKTFNELTYKGLLKIKEEYGIKINVRQVKDEMKYQYNLKKLAQRNDLVYGVGFYMKDAVEKVANNKQDTNFVLVDSESDLQNIKSIVFKEEEGSFLMGIIAGKMTKVNKVGFIGGIESITTQRFKSGYIAGVNAVNINASEDLINKKNVRYVGSFNDTDKAYGLAKQLYDNGCDIIYHVSGRSGFGVFKAAKESGKFAIGVDQDQAEIIPEYKDVILSSMIKNIDKASYNVALESLQGNFKGGIDNKLELGLKENGVGVAESTKNNVPKEILDLVEQYQKAIINGVVLIPKTPDEVKEFKRQTLK